MLIAVEGIDGAGKTTVAQLVAEELQRVSVDARYADKKASGQVAPEISARAGALSRLIWNIDAPTDSFGAEHWIFLVASWYSAVDRIQPLFSSYVEGLVIVDGWYYRNIAKMVVRSGADREWVDSLFASAVEPDLVVLLDVEPKVAWMRRDAFADTELGRWDGFEGAADEAFCSYQARVRHELVTMGEQRGWVQIASGPSSSPSAVAEEVIGQMPEPIFDAASPRGLA